MIDEITIAKMSDTLSIASELTRLKILVALLGENFGTEIHHEASNEAPKVELSVNELVEIVGASQSLISHQLKILKDASLVEDRRDGRQKYYSLSDEHVEQLISVVLEHVSEK